MQTIQQLLKKTHGDNYALPKDQYTKLVKSQRKMANRAQSPQPGFINTQAPFGHNSPKVCIHDRQKVISMATATDFNLNPGAPVTKTHTYLGQRTKLLSTIPLSPPPTKYNAGRAFKLM